MGSGRSKGERHRDQLATHRAVIRRLLFGWKVDGNPPAWHRPDGAAEPEEMTSHEARALHAALSVRVRR
jgi:hypothetical protein